MSIATDRIEPSGFRGGGGGGGVACAAVTPTIGNGKEEREEEEENWCSSSATSSIGRNSDLSGRSTTDGDDDGDDNEVQSAYNGPLDMMNSLEEVLPVRRGISSFYSGKSKSFTSLAEASSTSSIKDIAKQENAYSRRRRNLLAINHVWDKNRGSPHRINGCGIAKRPLSSSKSTLALAVAMSSSESLSSASDDSNSNSNSNSNARSPPSLPPLHPRSIASPWRSYSVADLQQCRAEGATDACSLDRDKNKRERLTRQL
ncbi:hypothetical protein KPL70_027292 [Citrus sinensis]|uniref:Uncharacterized protein n=1 Tax=Citrus sinensis TaxID=2711 RepID=A0A067G203_CITSI|nr:protein OXIDATIVE STRESS 3 LIKE 1 [Citrus sinensis]KAH9653091.1 hypothetical protein KPL70_027292 [Citrus sinensis]KDO73644.1 hypothetical protein CISIN_1g025086mg [Citrus sinensis]